MNIYIYNCNNTFNYGSMMKRVIEKFYTKNHSHFILKRY